MTQKDQVVTGETAVFDTKTNLVTMLGGVVLTQGKNVLRGDRLMVDMTTGCVAGGIRQRHACRACFSPPARRPGMPGTAPPPAAAGATQTK